MKWAASIFAGIDNRRVYPEADAETPADLLARLLELVAMTQPVGAMAAGWLTITVEWERV